ncbi:MAG: helix-turn-helix domain-containing protein [Clostridia bacterium]|nr:helix-turn-helix domain-containing protein [Clostridia bacterium]
MFLLHPLEPVFNVTHLINASSYHIPPDYLEPGERHDFWELVYADRGEIIIRADDNEYLLKTGEMAFHRPNEYHNVLPYRGRPSDIIIIAFVCENPQMSAFEQRIILLGSEEKDCLSRIVKEAERTYVYFENNPPLVKLIRSDDAPVGAEQLIRSGMEQLLIHLLRRSENIPINARMLPSNSANHHAALTRRAQEYMRQHYRDKLRLSDIASSMNISISLLKTVFREQAGTSVISYLTDLRIKEARRLIRENQYNFTQIADIVGYDSIYYFSTTFKRVTGMTPTEYARSVRQ